jgi:hypothetical protein
MELSGLQSFEAREQGPVPVSLLSGVRWGLWRLSRLGPLFYNLVETGSAGSGVLTRVFIASAVRPMPKG